MDFLAIIPYLDEVDVDKLCDDFDKFINWLIGGWSR